MKPLLPALIRSLLVASFLTSALLRANEPTFEQIVQERDQVLAQIVAQREARRATGMATDESIHEARLALHSFRRDTAASIEARIQEQQLIIQLIEKRVAAVQARLEAGIGDTEAILLARESLLAARQVLAHLRKSPPAAGT